MGASHSENETNKKRSCLGARWPVHETTRSPASAPGWTVARKRRHWRLAPLTVCRRRQGRRAERASLGDAEDTQVERLFRPVVHELVLRVVFKDSLRPSRLSRPPYRSEMSVRVGPGDALDRHDDLTGHRRVARTAPPIRLLRSVAAPGHPSGSRLSDPGGGDGKGGEEKRTSLVEINERTEVAVCLFAGDGCVVDRSLNGDIEGAA